MVSSTSVTGFLNKLKIGQNFYLFKKLIKEENIIENGVQLINLQESISPIIMGLTVDYLTRLSLGQKKEEVFFASQYGRELLWMKITAAYPGLLLSDMSKYILDEETTFFKQLINYYDQNFLQVDNSLSLQNALLVAKLSHYDAIGRALYTDIYPEQTTLDALTYDVIVQLVQRNLVILKKENNVVCSVHFTPDHLHHPFKKIIKSGDGDFYDDDFVWDLKVSSKKPSNKDFIQLMVYFLLGLNSSLRVKFKKISYIGIINPRLNKVYKVAIKDIPVKLWDFVCKAMEYGEGFFQQNY